MINFRKTTLALAALGFIAAPAFAETTVSTDTVVEHTGAELGVEGEGAITETVPANFDFAAYDTNHDEAVSEEEFAALADADVNVGEFASYDADANGSLNAEEFAALARSEQEVNIEDAPEAPADETQMDH